MTMACCRSAAQGGQIDLPLLLGEGPSMAANTKEYAVAGAGKSTPLARASALCRREIRPHPRGYGTDSVTGTFTCRETPPSAVIDTMP